MINTLDQPTEAFDVIQHLPSLRALARTLTRDRHAADDLVQETLAKAIASAEQFSLGSNLRAWLLTIMRNTYYSSLKRAAREQVGCNDCIASGLAVPSTQEWTIRGKELMNAVSQLPSEYRDVLVLVAMLGESYSDTAHICGCPIGTVKSRLNRARITLANILQGETT